MTSAQLQAMPRHNAVPLPRGARAAAVFGAASDALRGPRRILPKRDPKQCGGGAKGYCTKRGDDDDDDDAGGDDDDDDDDDDDEDEEEDYDVEEDDGEEETDPKTGKHNEAHFVRACAIKMRVDRS